MKTEILPCAIILLCAIPNGAFSILNFNTLDIELPNNMFCSVDNDVVAKSRIECAGHCISRTGFDNCTAYRFQTDGNATCECGTAFCLSGSSVAFSNVIEATVNRKCKQLLSGKLVVDCISRPIYQSGNYDV